MTGGPYRIALEFKQDCLVGATGMPETHLIVEYRTPVDDFWIAYSAKTMAEFLTELLREIAEMPAEYKDQVGQAVGAFIREQEEKAEQEYLRDVLAQNGGVPWEKMQPFTPSTRPGGMTGHG